MSSPFDCCLPCPPGSSPSANTVNIPGAQGEPGTPGADGADGADGENAFTITLGSSDTLLPAPNNPVSVLCEDVSWMQVGQNVFMSGTEGVANFQVISKNDTTNFAMLEFLAYDGDLASGLTISTGAGISPAGIQVQPVYPPTAYFVYKFETAQLAIASGQITNEAHGLNGIPDIITACLVSQDGSEGGYSAGDETPTLPVIFNDSDDPVFQPMFSFGKNNLNVWAGFLPAYGIRPFWQMSTKTGNATFQPDLTDATKWKLKLVAIKLAAP